MSGHAFAQESAEASPILSTTTVAPAAHAASTQQIKDQKREIQALTAKVNTLQAENQRLRMGVLPAQPQPARGEEDVRQIESLTKSLAAAKAELAAKSTQLQKKWDDDRSVFLKEKAALLTDKESAMSQIHALRQSLLERETQLRQSGDLKLDLERTAKEREELAKRSQSLQADLESAQETLATAETNANKLSGLLRESEGKMRELVERYRSTSVERDSALKEKSGLMASMGMLQTEKTSLKEHNAALSKMVLGLEAQAGALKSALAVKEEALKKEMTKTAMLNQSLAAVSSGKEGLTRQNEKLLAERIQRGQEAEASAKKIKELTAMIQKLQAENAKTTLLKEEVLRARMEKQELEKKLSDLGQLNAKLAALQAANRELDHVKATLEADLIDMRNLKSSFESYLDSLVAGFAERRQRARSKNPEALRQDIEADLTDIQNLKSNFELYLESLISHFEERRGKKN